MTIIELPFSLFDLLPIQLFSLELEKGEICKRKKGKKKASSFSWLFFSLRQTFFFHFLFSSESKRKNIICMTWLLILRRFEWWKVPKVTLTWHLDFSRIYLLKYSVLHASLITYIHCENDRLIVAIIDSQELRNYSSSVTNSAEDCSVGSSRRASRASRRGSSVKRGRSPGPPQGEIVTLADASGQEVEVEVVSGPPPRQYRVAMLGASGVGKSSLTSQFLSSDHMNTYDNVGELNEFRHEILTLTARRRKKCAFVTLFSSIFRGWRSKGCERERRWEGI